MAMAVAIATATAHCQQLRHAVYSAAAVSGLFISSLLGWMSTHPLCVMMTAFLSSFRALLQSGSFGMKKNEMGGKNQKDTAVRSLVAHDRRIGNGTSPPPELV